MVTAMKRPDGRAPSELRRVRIAKNYVRTAAGSVLIEMGKTRVICAASVEEAVPRWMREQGIEGGWVTGEYSMLPYSTPERKPRDATRGRVDGRTQEIQRLVGRALRAAVDLKKLGARTIWIDCDVLEADGGTRTAAITGGFVALALALRRLQKEKAFAELPLLDFVAATSVGICHGTPVLDLCYAEDSTAEVDMNVVMTARGKFIEVQGTAEKKTFSRAQLDKLLQMAQRGIRELVAVQRKTLRM
jgi:ribonuclease PH